MYKMFMLLFLVVSFSANAEMFDEWSSDDSIRQAVATSTIIIDWGQTLDISSKCENTSIYETNPILGRCPSRGEVNKYFAASVGVNYLISRALPKKYRKGWQYMTIVYQAGFISNNYNLGIKVKF